MFTLQSVMHGLLAGVITAGTAIITFVSDKDVVSISDIGSATWLVIGVGFLMNMAKDIQSRNAPSTSQQL